MKAPILLNQYWQLARVMVFPLRVVRWLFIVTSAVIILGGMLTLVDHSIVLTIGLGVFLILLMVVGMLVPGQMLALASSKQFRYMSELRHKLFAVVGAFWFLVAFLTSSVLFFLAPEKVDFWATFSVALFIISATVVSFSIVISYFPMMQGFIPFGFFIVFGAFEYSGLIIEIHRVYLWCGSLMLWGIFYFWWLQWQPKKYLLNFMTLSAAEMQRQVDSIQSAGYGFSSLPRTLQGSLLIGASDGVKSWLKRDITQLVIFLAVFVLVMFWVKRMPENVSGTFVVIFVFIFICVRGGIFFQTLYRNIYRLWMNSVQSRGDNFSHLERNYFFLFFASVAPVVLFFTLINTYFLGGLVSLFYVGYVLLIAILFVSYSFYLGLLVYAKCSASLVALNWIGSVANISLMIVMAYFNILWGPHISHEHADYLTFSGVLFMLLILLRLSVKSSWKTVNFYRVKN